MYETLTFTGGIHKSEELKELIEDLGGFVLQSNILQMELVLNMAVPPFFCSSKKTGYVCILSFSYPENRAAK